MILTTHIVIRYMIQPLAPSLQHETEDKLVVINLTKNNYYLLLEKNKGNKVF